LSSFLRRFEACAEAGDTAAADDVAAEVELTGAGWSAPLLHSYLACYAAAPGLSLAEVAQVEAIWSMMVGMEVQPNKEDYFALLLCIVRCGARTATDAGEAATAAGLLSRLQPLYGSNDLPRHEELTIDQEVQLFDAAGVSSWNQLVPIMQSCLSRSQPTDAAAQQPADATGATGTELPLSVEKMLRRREQASSASTPVFFATPTNSQAQAGITVDTLTAQLHAAATDTKHPVVEPVKPAVPTPTISLQHSSVQKLVNPKRAAPTQKTKVAEAPAQTLSPDVRAARMAALLNDDAPKPSSSSTAAGPAAAKRRFST